MPAIERTIENVERLYKNLTGRDCPPPDVVFAPIPAERDPGEHVEEQLDRLLEALGQPMPGVPVMRTNSAPARVPPATLWESDTEFLLSMELPGVARDQVEVAIQGNTLIVTGRRQPANEDSMTLRAMEVPAATFRRTFPLPPGVKTSDPVAQMRDGVLAIRIAKDESRVAEARPIPVS
jgi:HSP20 family protein